MRTARSLRELAELGVRRNAVPVRKAATWLLSRPESPHKPGAFLLTDELVDELDFCVKKGRTKPGKHFRERTKPAEKVAAAEGDDMFRRGCGPRFLWPNAVAVEALALAGYGDHPRVKAAVAAAVGSDWCEPRLWGHGPGPILRYGSDANLCCPAAMDLDTIARFDYPVTKMRIMIAVPDIVRTQNDDGSWGRAPHIDMTTFSVARALLKVRGLLPQSALP
jgi:hypothetical protein